MSAPMLRTVSRAVQAPQMRTIVTRSMPRAGGGHDDHPHLVFDTAKEPFTKLSAGLIVGGGVFAGIGIVVGAITHQNYKHGYWGRSNSAAEYRPEEGVHRRNCWFGGGGGCIHEEHGHAQPRWFDILDRTHCFEGCGARLNLLAVFMQTM